MKQSRLSLFITASLLGVSPQMTMATPQQSEDDLAIENITVTAQRKAQSIQIAPVSVTALSARDIDRMQIDNAKDLSQVAPNVSIQPVTGGSASIAPYVRGGGVRDTAVITSEAEVGIYIDDVYQPRSAASFIEMLDLERIEVLRGPQGTLYGRNSSAGAVKFVSRTPDELFRLKNEAGVGSWNEIYNKLSVSGPLNDSGKLRGGISAMYRDRDGGRQYNQTLEREVGEERYAGFQGDLYYVADDYDIRFKAYYTDYDSDGLYGSALEPAQLDKPYTEIPFVSGSIDTVLSPEESYTSDKQYGANLKITAELNHSMELVTITAWNDLQDDWAVGFSGGVQPALLGLPGDEPLEVFYRESTSEQDSFTQEIQLLGDTLNGALSYIGGLYYFTESGSQYIDNMMFFAPDYTEFNISTDSYAGFGQVTWHVSDQVDITIGGRYTKDNKEIDALVSGEAVLRDVDFSRFTPKLGIDYKIADNILMFAIFTGGFKAGGYNGLASTAEALDTVVQMQLMDAYELGIKSDWMKGRLRANLAAFFNDYEKLQQGVVTDDGIFIAENYDAEHKGIEAELQFRVTSEFSLWANGVYQSNEYTNTYASEGQSSGTLLGNSMTGAFDYQYAAGGDYTVNIGDGVFTLGANVNRRGDYYSTADNAKIGHVPDMTLYDAYMSYQLDRWTVKLAGKNLTDEKYWFTGFGFSVVQPRFMADPKMWRLSVAYLIE
ncbi:MAG: TonB-dependent receptor [Alteromonadaceae bacterium]|nr:TonB-dependent receptor [Alteromonadaceae bacterium]